MAYPLIVLPPFGLHAYMFPQPQGPSGAHEPVWPLEPISTRCLWALGTQGSVEHMRPCEHMSPCGAGPLRPTFKTKLL